MREWLLHSHLGQCSVRQAPGRAQGASSRGRKREENGLRGPGRKKREEPAEGREGRGTGNYCEDPYSLVSP